jgi:MYXO-CTERM domain-containing protein
MALGSFLFGVAVPGGKPGAVLGAIALGIAFSIIRRQRPS